MEQIQRHYIEGVDSRENQPQLAHTAKSSQSFDEEGKDLEFVATVEVYPEA